MYIQIVKMVAPFIVLMHNHLFDTKVNRAPNSIIMDVTATSLTSMAKTTYHDNMQTDDGNCQGAWVSCLFMPILSMSSFKFHKKNYQYKDLRIA